MKHFFTFLFFIPVLVLSQNSLNINKISDALEAELMVQPNQYHLVSILLQDRVDSRGLHQNYRKFKTPLKDRAYEIITKLQAKAAKTQGPILTLLSQSSLAESGSIESFWITNVIFVKAKPELIATLSNRQDIEWIDKSYPVELDSYKREFAPFIPKRSVNGHEPGHDAINAPAMWSLGYTGRGRTAMIFDSGVDGTHPALRDNFKGNYFPPNWGWLDINDANNFTPEYCRDHGTHVGGIAIGLDRSTNDTIGVAPNGYWIGSDGTCVGVNQINMTTIFQWCINPDNDPNTIGDMPDVVNCSWFHPGFTNECNSYYVSLFNNLEAAGVALVYSAGNAGSGVSTVTPPKNINTDTVNVLCVGNLNGNNPNLPIANSSSRGPSTCTGTGSLLIKPEVSAPGVSVRSSVPNGYSNFTGTSMAAPHVAGAILLLKEAFPYLSGTDIKLALYYSAVDLGTPGEDNAYGNGIIDVLAAYNYLVIRGNNPVLPSNYNDASFVSVFQQNETICDSVVFPAMTVKNEGGTVINSLLIKYLISNGDTGSYVWSGTINPGQSSNLILSATTLALGGYDVEYEIAQVNGVADSFFIGNKASGSFNLIGEPVPPAPDPINVCNGSQGLLTAYSEDQDVTLRWYESQNGKNFFGDGNQFLTPNLTATQSYYIGAIYKKSIGLEDNVGAPGFYTNTVDNGLVFDTKLPSKINSVKIYANSSGNRNIILKDAVGTIIGSWIGNVNAGESKINLDFDVPVGEGFELLMGSAGIIDLYANLGGYSFPYTFRGFFSITGSTNTIYNYFYDWDVEMELPCTRAFTFASVSNGSANADFTPSDTVVDISNGSSVQFLNNSTNASTYLWNFGDSTTSTAVNPSHNYFVAGTYTVGLTAEGSDNCVDAITKTVRITGEWPYITDLEDEFAKYGTINIYPNPGSGLFQIDLDLKSNSTIEFTVFDAAGRQIWNKGKADYFKQILSLDLTNMTQGVYYLSIKIDEKTLVKKLLKTN